MNTEIKKRIEVIMPESSKWTEITNIVWIEAYGKGSLLFLADGEILHSKKILKYYSDLLHERSCYRIHDKYLVNVSFVAWHAWEKECVRVASKDPMCRWNNVQLDISVRKRKKFENFMRLRVKEMQEAHFSTIFGS